MSSSIVTTEDAIWNRDATFVRVKHVSSRSVFADAFSGLAAPLLVTPAIALIDGSIIRSASDKTKTLTPISAAKTSVEELSRGVNFRPWSVIAGLCWMVYGGTYLSVNLTRSYYEAKGMTDEEYKYQRFGVATASNVGLTLIKDRLLVNVVPQLTGDKPAKVPVRALSMGCFLTRDSITMATSFVVADRLGEHLHTAYGMDAWTARQIGTLCLPAALQMVSTPIHLFGLNYAYSPSLAMRELAKMCFNAQATMSRMARIFVSVGIASNMNNSYRDSNLRKYA